MLKCTINLWMSKHSKRQNIWPVCSYLVLPPDLPNTTQTCSAILDSYTFNDIITIICRVPLTKNTVSDAATSLTLPGITNSEWTQFLTNIAYDTAHAYIHCSEYKETCLRMMVRHIAQTAFHVKSLLFCAVVSPFQESTILLQKSRPGELYTMFV